MEKSPKKKAKELVKWFKDMVRIDHTFDDEPFFENQKSCAIKVCDEMIKETSSFRSIHKSSLDVRYYWLEVKKEVELLEK